MANGRLIAIAGGSGFIGRAIVRRLVTMTAFKVRVLSRNPDRARKALAGCAAEFVRAEVTAPESLKEALADVQGLVNAVQFQGYPVEDPARGLTFERVDYGGTLALLENARNAGATQFVYISGAAADADSPHPGFRAKGRAERAIAESGLDYTIFRPSLVFGPEDRTVNLFAKALRFAPVFAVPGTGQQKVQPVFVEDVAACVALALTSPEAARNRIFEVGGPDLMTFDELMQMVMDLTGRHRPLVHVPEGLLKFVGGLASKLPRPLLSADAITFVTADNACKIGPLVEALGIKLTPAREGMAYLRPKME